MKGIADLYRVHLTEGGISAGDTSPMMVFPIGEWHSSKYPTLPLTEDLANELIANFEAGVLGTEPVVDSSGKHDTSAPAAGWVKRVYLASYEEGTVTGLALWADVKWTDLGAGLLMDEQYKYGSVEIGPVVLNDSGETVDNVLRSLTLTNTPVLRLMPGVQNAAEKQRAVVTLSLSEVTLAEPGSFNALRDALELAIGEAHGERIWVCDFGPEWVVYEQGGFDDVSHTYKASYVKDDQGITLGQPVEVKRETTYVPVSDGASGSASSSSSPAYAVGMAEEGTPAALAEDNAAQRGAEPHMDPKTLTILKLAEGADDTAIDAAVVALAEERDNAMTKLADVEKATHDADVASRLDKAVELAEITPGERITLAEKDDAHRDAFLEARKGVKALALGENGTGEKPVVSDDVTVELDERAKKIVTERGVGYGEAQALALTEDPAFAERYANRTL